MAVQVEHEKRKHEILTKALELFIEEGYEDVTFQKIADRCGITRTTLYIYFKNKREIFLWSIKQFTQALEQEILTILKNPQYTSIECLECIFDMIIMRAEENYQFFKVLLTYLIQLQKSGANVNERVARRTIRIQHILSTIVIRGQKNGEIKKLPVKNINDQLYMLLECGIFRLAVLGKQKLDGIREMVAFSISQFREE